MTFYIVQYELYDDMDGATHFDQMHVEALDELGAMNCILEYWKDRNRNQRVSKITRIALARNQW